MIQLHYYTATRRKVTIDVEVDDSSYRYRALTRKTQLVLKFALPEYINFPVGTWCVYQNETYRLNNEKNLKKHGTRNIAYEMILGGDEDKLGFYKFRNTVDGRLKFSMCAKPHELLDEVVKNLNAREGANVWSAGSPCVESTEKTVEFNHCYIDAALQSIADTFETEWEIVNHVIYLRKVEYNKNNPLPLSYGRGNGFVPGLGRTTDLNEAPIKRIYTQGGTRNIDRSKYGGKDSPFPEYETNSAELLLPPSQTLEYEGRTYKTDAQGYYVERSDKVSNAVKEDSLDCSEIYPSRVGTVGEVITVKPEKHFYDFVDTSIPEALDYNACFIEGETPTIKFQSGMLAGKEFEFKYIHEERRFEIAPQEIDGIVMPDPATGYMPVTGNEYAVFGIMLPKPYFFDNATKTGASWDMFREAARKLYEHEDPKFTFKGDLQGLWAKRNWLNIGGKIKVGGYILFSDEQFAPDGVKIRIIGIKDYVNAPYAPVIEISNAVSGSTVRSELAKIENAEVVVGDKTEFILQFTKRRFRDAKETIEMLEDAMLDNFTNSISPVAVQTMAALIGDESLQYRFVASKSNYTPVPFNISYNQETKTLHCPQGFLQHMTLGITSVSSSHSDSEYKCWAVEEFHSPVLTESAKKYYLYAIVDKGDTEVQGAFALSPSSLPFNGTGSLGDISLNGKYCLLVGVLNSEQNGERSFVTLYGFTEILPGRITTDRIVSSDGESYLDLVDGIMKLGDCLAYNVDGKKQLYLKFLLAENANLANLIFRNQRLESSAESNGVPNFFIDGLNNIASFSAGNVVFDKNSAKIGWLRVIGKDLVGYDNDGIERLMLTPDTLPAITSSSRRLARVVDCGGDPDVSTEIGQETSFYAERHVSQISDRYDDFFDDNGDMNCWVDIEIPAPATTIFLSDTQFSCKAQTVSGQYISPNCTLTASVKYKDGATIGSVDLSGSNPQITIPQAGTIRISFFMSCNYSLSDWTGRAMISFQGFPISDVASRTVIARNGVMAIFNGNYMRMHSTEGFTVKIGNNGFRITADGIQKTTNGTTWSNV